MGDIGEVEIVNVEVIVERADLLASLQEILKGYVDLKDKSYFRRKRKEMGYYTDRIESLIRNIENVNTDYLRFQIRTLRDLLEREKAFDKNGLISLGVVILFFIISTISSFANVLHILIKQ